MASHPHVDGVMDGGGPQPRRQQQQLEGGEVQRDEQQRPAVGQRLRQQQLTRYNFANEACTTAHS